jgi:glucose-1-phosphate adenylyltransferase
MGQTVCIILGGGRGTRLQPLTRDRSKPAVPLAGKYRLIDIPVSNCLNSGLQRIFVLTQFNTASLHRHIAHTFKFDDFGGGFVEILAAEQTTDNTGWYQGTADAVRQNLRHLNMPNTDLCLILSGDQLYQMDFRRMVEFHRQREAAITVAVTPVRRSEAGGLGILQTGPELQITQFHEKPKDPAVLDGLTTDPASLAALGINAPDRPYLASMGIYLFNAEVLRAALGQSDADDFGGQVLPQAIETCANCVYAFPFEGYWEDIGTIGSFFEANLNLTEPVPRFNLFDEDNPVWTHPRYLPASKLNACDAERVIVGDGSILDSSRLHRCVIGLRSVIREGCDLENVVMMGADFFETPEHRRRHETEGLPPIGIGRRVHVRNAIIDKNARIGEGATINYDPARPERDGPEYWVRDGIVIVPRSGIITPGTVI